MPKPERQYPFNFGRVFFPEKYNPIPNRVYFQPLGNHVGNVRRLVKAWNLDDFPGTILEERQKSFQRVLKAADIHDMGKPQKFNLAVKTTKTGKFKEYIYSFKGHRFLANNPNIWAKTLAVGHHDFSVADISRDTYKLKKQSQYYADILAQYPLAYARELYILEMCDQIEAELACRVIGDDKQAESRAFMDYTTKQSELDSQIYFIDPCPFKENSISLKFEYWSMELSQADKDSLQNCLDKGQHNKLGIVLDKIAKDWWQSQQGKPKKSEPKLINLKTYQLDNNLKDWNCEFLYKALGGEQFMPNPMQKEMWDAIANNDHPAILLKSPTGSGKMEAILFPSLAKGYRLLLPLPARSLLEDQKERIDRYLKKFSTLQRSREISLVVDTGSQMHRWVYLNGEDITSTLNINSRRHLYKGDVILTTIDKFLYRYFAFGDKQKSFIFPIRIHKEKTLICFDESHSYENISFTNFQSLVKSLYEAGRSLVLMTATMPPELCERFEYLDLIDFIDEHNHEAELNHFQQQTLNHPALNKKAFEWNSHIQRNKDTPESFQNEFAQIIFREWQAKANRRIIVVVETVKDAVAIYQQLKNKFCSNTDALGRFLFLYHGRIAEQHRPSIYKQLQERDASNQPYILVTTSAIEVGCDLNAEVLISQTCPPENLIQRAGRCNRKGNVSNAKVILVGDEIPEFANSLDEFGWQKYQQTLQSLKDFDTKAVAKCITRSHQIDDYRVVELFSMLYDYVYGADLTCQPLHKRGLIPTRSWTPSVNLVHIGSQHSISVPIDRFCYGQKYADTYAYEKYYDQENTRWDRDRLLGWGSAYGKEITVRISPNGVDINLPKYEYDEELGFVKIPKIFVKKWIDGAEEKLLYVEGEHKGIVSYIKSLEQ